MPSMPPVRITQSFGDIATRDQNRVDREDDVGQLDLDDGGPERRQPEPGCAFGGARGAPPRSPLPKKCAEREVQQVRRADQLHPPEPDQVHGQQRRDAGTRTRRGCRSAAPSCCSRFGRPSTRTASTIALSALSSPSSATSSPMVSRSDGESSRIPVYTACNLTRLVSMPILGSAQGSWTTICISSAWRRGCSACIRRRCGNTSGWGWFSRRARRIAGQLQLLRRRRDEPALGRRTGDRRRQPRRLQRTEVEGQRDGPRCLAAADLPKVGAYLKQQCAGTPGSPHCQILEEALQKAQ